MGSDINLKTRIVPESDNFHVVSNSGAILATHKSQEDAEYQQRLWGRLDQLIFRLSNLLSSVKKMDEKSTSFDVKKEALKSQIFMDELNGKIDENLGFKEPKKLNF
jgi:hypothetical protein